MKVVTWNINGIRTFRGGIKKALDSLDADIICVQETKVTRDLLDERTAIVDGYNSYFSYSRGRSGYSAEEGLTGLLTNHEGAVGCYGHQAAEFCSEELQLLDNEGRAVVTQHRAKCQDREQTVTVINVYCPRADPEKPERKQFKLQFYKLLRCRAEAILKDGSHVIVLGDINTSHRQIDHCDPSDIDDFDENPGRKWLNGFLYSGGQEEETNDEESDGESEVTSTDQIRSGKFVDTFRYFHPTRTNAFTCWSTLTGARQTNYGTRIDYIFADCQLAKEQFVAADIMPEVEGSDHCPVWGQLSCCLLPSSKPPPLCTRYLPEFAGKQQKLSRFLVKVEQKSSQSELKDALPGSQEEEERRENLNPSRAEHISGKKRLLTESVAPKGKKTKTVKTSSKPQGSLLSFFKPKLTNVVPAAEPPCEKALGTEEVTSLNKSQKASTATDDSSVMSNRSEDTEFAFHGSPQLGSSNTTTTEENDRHMKTTHLTSQPTVGRPAAKKGASLGFWKSVLHGPPPPPSCKVHGEPCVLRTVKKEGPNMGKQFFVCARPQGHTSNPDARCNFFAWVDKGK
ncbi:DNA-(apurinic or apyrimidinic site) lyase 2 [Collichthys lucidus]|uniref:DNA-(apurinic or apyrimidinic site) endonuclease n=1 Tax=Collichthys lucidus TaxID=240159 RepID=A0A4U5UNY2_COLLU|nr:DNA-(apurinic or apyrimidinic site) lyase 2 [Collichthys lucidus]